MVLSVSWCSRIGIRMSTDMMKSLPTMFGLCPRVVNVVDGLLWLWVQREETNIDRFWSICWRLRGTFVVVTWETLTALQLLNQMVPDCKIHLGDLQKRKNVHMGYASAAFRRGLCQSCRWDRPPPDDSTCSYVSFHLTSLSGFTSSDSGYSDQEDDEWYGEWDRWCHTVNLLEKVAISAFECPQVWVKANIVDHHVHDWPCGLAL